MIRTNKQAPGRTSRHFRGQSCNIDPKLTSPRSLNVNMHSPSPLNPRLHCGILNGESLPDVQKTRSQDRLSETTSRSIRCWKRPKHRMKLIEPDSKTSTSHMKPTDGCVMDPCSPLPLSSTKTKVNIKSAPGHDPVSAPERHAKLLALATMFIHLLNKASSQPPLHTKPGPFSVPKQSQSETHAMLMQHKERERNREQVDN